MADSFPTEIVTYTREQVLEKYARDYQFRQPLADVGPGTQPAIDAAVCADALAVLHADAVVIGNNTKDETSTDQAVDDALRVAGVPPRLPATGAVGYVTITASVGGVNIIAGSEIKTKATPKRYQSFVTGLYQNGDQVLIGGIDTGPSTNQDAGTVMVWTSPPPGLATEAVVWEASDGTGLTGGRLEESDAEAIARLIATRANPPASGNEAAYIKETEATPGLAIQKALAYPASPAGPGNMSVAFLLRPATPGANRLPSGAQRALVAANLAAVFPGDDGIFVLDVVGEPLDIHFGVAWRESAVGWADKTPWPPYISGDPVVVKTGTSPTALVVRVITGTATTSPQTGQTVAFWNGSTGVFVPKRIASFVTHVADQEWTLTFDTSNAASDTTYVPFLGQTVMPYSESLDDVVSAVIAHIDGMGPGEVVAVFPDPGLRQRRTPRSPAEWPHDLTNRVLTGVLAVGSIADAELLYPSVPYPVPVGTPGVLVYLFELRDLALFEQ